MKEVIIATNNAGKAKDFETLFKPFGVKVLTLNDIERILMSKKQVLHLKKMLF